ncbi:hypothetical protein KEM48_009346 [Puccinia striiformis f. sp. tritici PST-130]|nr:hypothetical protein KEM48_009346 [Puccinia striiformis f. sp. tritici PST-130]
MAAQAPYGQAFISGIFLSLWFLFSNFVLLQMFIAVISEGFAVAEEQKKKEQIRALVNRNNPQSELPSCLKDSILTSELPPKNLIRPILERSNSTIVPSLDALAKLSFWIRSMAHSWIQGTQIERHYRRTRRLRRPDRWSSLNTPSQRQQYYTSSNEQQEREAQFIKDHPTYDKVFWFISQRNPIRRLCQFLVEPSHGERTLVVIVAAIATPVYKQHYYLINGEVVYTWYNLTEVILGLFFVIEFCIKVLADGFILPECISSQYLEPDRFLGLRALRMINLTMSMRETFYNNLFAGLYGCNDSSSTILGKAQCVASISLDPVRDYLSGGMDQRHDQSDVHQRKDKQPSQDASQWNAIYSLIYNLFGATIVLTLFLGSNSNTPMDLYRVIALLGLGWISFQQNRWRIYDVIVIAGTFGTTIPTIIFPDKAGPTSLTRYSNYQSLANARHACYPKHWYNRRAAILHVYWLVVDNFAYVFQLFGKVKAINREEVRRFKEAWASVDWCIRRNIYPDDLKMKNLVDSMAVVGSETKMLYQEALLTEKAGRGISFNRMMLLGPSQTD